MTKADHLALVARQINQARKAGLVECAGELCDRSRRVRVWLMFRCLYCGRFFCRRCARQHFGDIEALEAEGKPPRRIIITYKDENGAKRADQFTRTGRLKLKTGRPPQ